MRQRTTQDYCAIGRAGIVKLLEQFLNHVSHLFQLQQKIKENRSAHVRVIYYAANAFFIAFFDISTIS